MIMQIEYPIFVKDRDSWVSIVHNDINELEIIDVEDREFVGCWDKNGLPLRLYLEGDEKKKEIKVEVESDITQLDKLKEAILGYAKLARPKESFNYFGPQDNVVELFKAAEDYIKIGIKCKTKNRMTMISAILSIILGILSLISHVPVALPVFGLALGVNALIKEKKNTDKRKAVIIIAITGVIINGFIALVFIGSS